MVEAARNELVPDALNVYSWRICLLIRLGTCMSLPAM
jgi:hypothetical protein